MQHTLAPIQPPGRTWLRPLYFVAGILSVAVGAIGIVLPLVPTTGPLLLAAFFFARSSERLHRWITTHPRFGHLIADFQAGRGIPRRAKVTALTMMTLAFSFSLIVVTTHPVARLGVGAVALWAITYVARLPISRR